MRATEFITELFEPKAPTWEWVFRGSEEATADFKVGDVPYRFHAYSNGENDWEVEFKVRTYDRSTTARKTRFGLTGTGNSAEVMSTVVDIMREFLEMYRGKIDTIGFTAEEPSRQKLYMRMMKRLLPNWTISTYDSGSGLGFTVVAPENLDEEVLDETTEQDQILTHIATAATKRIVDIFNKKEKWYRNADIAFDPEFVLSRRDRLTWFNGLYLRQLYLPEVNDPQINEMINNVKVQLVDDYSDTNRKTLGAYVTYMSGAKGIEIYLPMIRDKELETGIGVINEIRSTFIHEMQHALDDIKSKGKYDSTQSRMNKPDTGDNEKKYLTYLKLPHEINARFTQALLDIAEQLANVEGPVRLVDLIRTAFYRHNLHVISKRQFKHLITRAYKFFDAYQNKPVRVEPKSLAKRALAWITSSPTSEIK